MVANFFFSSSIQAMKSQSQAFAAISDNIANVNTAGYKTAEVQFDSLIGSPKQGSLYQSLNGTRGQVRNWVDRQGQVLFTNRNLDVAMIGKGFFYTNSALDNSGETLLTKSGRFSSLPDPDPTSTNAYLSDGFGNYVMGWPYVTTTNSFSVGSDESSLRPIRTDQGGIIFQASPSTTGSITANLPADAAIGTSHRISLDVLDGTGIELDANGFVIDASDRQGLNFDFVKTAANTWEITPVATDGTVTAPVAPATLTFDSTGLNPSIGGGTTMTVSANWTSPAGATNTIVVDFGNLTQYGGSFDLTGVETNGIEEGFLESVSVDGNGVVQGAFSNGLSRPIAMLAVADVRSENLLDPVANTHFRVSEASGAISLYRPDQTKRVSITGGAYESSETDLTDQVSRMIQTQRAYTSAATSLKTIDEMTKTASDLK